jgi:uncharacterized damage-inducible protein DinB
MNLEAWTEVDDTVERLLAASNEVSPDLPCLGRWTVKQTLAHIASGLELHHSLLDGHPSPIDLDSADTYAEQGIAARNNTMVKSISAEIDTRYSEFRDRAQSTPPTQLIRWHSGIRLTARSVIALSIAEILIHTFDICQLTDRKQRLPKIACREVLWSLGPVYSQLAPKTPPAYKMLLRDIADPQDDETRPLADFTIRVTPDAALLFAYRRYGFYRLAIHGKPIVTGRRPWLALSLASTRPR